MSGRTLIVLVVAAAVVGVGASVVVRRQRAATAPIPTPERLFEGLGAKVNDVALLTIEKGGEELRISRTPEGEWGLAERGGYPVEFEKVKGTIVGVADLRPVEAKTSRPELYSKIGVQDPGEGEAPAASEPAAPGADSEPTLVTLRDAQGEVLASVILGNQKPVGGGGGASSVYVRRTGEAQSWLAEGLVEAPTGVTGWVEPQIVNIGQDRIGSASVTHPDGSVLAIRRDAPAVANFTVEGVPEGRELKSETAANSLASGLAYLSLEDVVPAERIDFGGAGTPGRVGAFRTFDGLVVTVRTVEIDGKTWAMFEAVVADPPPASVPTEPVPAMPEGTSQEGTEAGETPPAPLLAPSPSDAVKAEAEELNAKLGKWAFAIPSYKAQTLAMTLEGVLKETGEPPAPVEPGMVGPQPEGAPLAPWERPGG